LGTRFPKDGPGTCGGPFRDGKIAGVPPAAAGLPNAMSRRLGRGNG
jgi:hypothetical protein